jgi:hypothetical protein
MLILYTGRLYKYTGGLRQIEYLLVPTPRRY